MLVKVGDKERLRLVSHGWILTQLTKDNPEDSNSDSD